MGTSLLRSLVESILREEFEASLMMGHPRYGRNRVDIFTNPTSRELSQDVVHTKSARAILVGKNICYAWNPYNAIHHDVMESGVVKLGNAPLPIELFFDDDSGGRLSRIRVAPMSAAGRWESAFMNAKTEEKKRKVFRDMETYIKNHSYIKDLWVPGKTKIIIIAFGI